MFLVFFFLRLEIFWISGELLANSVPDKQGVSGQKPDKVSNMTRQINRKFMMIWWEHWRLTSWNSSWTPYLENLSGTLADRAV